MLGLKEARLNLVDRIQTDDLARGDEGHPHPITNVIRSAYFLPVRFASVSDTTTLSFVSQMRRKRGFVIFVERY